MRISDWSSDVCSSDLPGIDVPDQRIFHLLRAFVFPQMTDDTIVVVTSRSPGDHLFLMAPDHSGDFRKKILVTNGYLVGANVDVWKIIGSANRSEEHTSELQSLMRISYAVFCLKKKKN